MASVEVKYTTSQKMTVAYVEVKGAYSQVEGAMKELKEWIDSKGIEQGGYPFCMFFDNPLDTPANDLRSEVCIPVAASFESDGTHKVKMLPDTSVAETRHSGVPEEFFKTYGPFLEGLLNGGYSLAGPAREYFMTVTEVKGPGSGFLIQQPITKK